MGQFNQKLTEQTPRAHVCNRSNLGRNKKYIKLSPVTISINNSGSPYSPSSLCLWMASHHLLCVYPRTSCVAGGRNQITHQMAGFSSIHLGYFSELPPPPPAVHYEAEMKKKLETFPRERKKQIMLDTVNINIPRTVIMFGREGEGQECKCVCHTNVLTISIFGELLYHFGIEFAIFLAHL